MSKESPERLEDLTCPREIIRHYAPTKNIAALWEALLEEKEFHKGFEVLVEALIGQLEDFLASDDEVLVVNISGFPSAGKSSVSEMFNERLVDSNLAIPMLRVDQDLFHGTARGTPERDQMLDSYANLKKNLYQFRRLREFFSAVLNPEQRGKFYEMDGLYNRADNGQMTKEEKWRIPEGKHILFSEGLNATGNFSHWEKRQEEGDPNIRKFRVVNAFLLDDPGRQLQGAMARDFDRDNHTEADRMRFRIREFLLMIRMQMANIQRADMICVEPERIKKRKKRNVGSLKKDEAFHGQCETVLGEFANKVLAQIAGFEKVKKAKSADRQDPRRVAFEVSQKIIERAKAVTADLDERAEQVKCWKIQG